MLRFARMVCGTMVGCYANPWSGFMRNLGRVSSDSVVGCGAKPWSGVVRIPTKPPQLRISAKCDSGDGTFLSTFATVGTVRFGIPDEQKQHLFLLQYIESITLASYCSLGGIIAAPVGAVGQIAYFQDAGVFPTYCAKSHPRIQTRTQIVKGLNDVAENNYKIFSIPY